MGRFTSEYNDNVLAAKFKNLVSGAIKRSKIESGEQTISYEAFVQELDEGDSFTTTLVELLVKEVAERRTRHSAPERRTISDRTAQGLRLLSSTNRAFRERHIGRSRRYPVVEQYASQDDWELEPPRPDRLDDDEIDEALSSENYIALEGTRIDSSLYDAYRPYNFTTSSRPYPFIAPPRPTSAGDAQDLSQPPRQAPIALPPHYHRPAAPVGIPIGSAASFARGVNATALTRQPSIRRSTRSRASDFNDFASRRRSTHRQTQEAEVNVSGGPSAPATRRSPVQDDRHSLVPNDDFFHPYPSSSIVGRLSFLLGNVDEAANHDGSMPLNVDAYTLSRNSRGSEPRLDGQPSAPRLRRGGLRPPEAMLPVLTLPPLSINTSSNPPPSNLFHEDPVDWDSREIHADMGQWLDPESSPGGTLTTREDHPDGLPTPRSVSPHVDSGVVEDRD